MLYLISYKTNRSFPLDFISGLGYVLLNLNIKLKNIKWKYLQDSASQKLII